MVGAEALVAVGVLTWMRRQIGPLRRPMVWVQGVQFLRHAAPIGGSQILRAVALGSDIVLVGLLLTMTDAGWYSGAYKIFMLGVSLSAAYFVILFPQFAQQAADSTAALARELRVSLARVLAVAVPALGLGIWIAGDILATLYEPSFGVATRTLRILLVVVAIAIVNGHIRHALIVLGRQQQDLRNVAVSSTVHVIMKLALIPSIGIAGAAVGSLVGESVLMVLGWSTLRPILRATVVGEK